MLTTLFISLSLSLASAGPGCPVGDIKACQTYLKAEHAKKDDVAFAEKYAQVCAENKTFSCVKLTVRDDVNAVMKEQVKMRGPKAALFNITPGDETYIYILSPK